MLAGPGLQGGESRGEGYDTLFSLPEGLTPVYTYDFSCDLDAILRMKPASAYLAWVFSRVTLR